MPVADHVIRYALQFTRLTRRGEGERARISSTNYVAWGAGPRAASI